MFTLLVSWLLVACVPGLLMLATLWLGRLERDLASDTVTASDVAQFLDQAEAVDLHTLAREGMPEALEYLHRRQALHLNDFASRHHFTGPRHAAPNFASNARDHRSAVLPTTTPRHSRVNPQVTETRHVNRV
jgi:hypothetical protein